jgi:hypothetical protein
MEGTTPTRADFTENHATYRSSVNNCTSSEEMIKQAILEGEAYAVKKRGIRGIWLRGKSSINKKNKEESDLPEHVARSFGGSVEDRFIQTRLPKIHRRAASTLASMRTEPRRGFDALVEALLSTTKAIEEPEVEREIAQAIDASVDDRVVHVLAVRIMALRKGEQPSHLPSFIAASSSPRGR